MEKKIAMNKEGRTIGHLSILIALVALFGCSKSGDYGKFKVRSGDFRVSIIESGSLEAINSKMITMPFLGWRYGWRFKILSLEEHGTKVSKGEKVVGIDPSQVIRVLEEEQNRLENEQANLNKLNVSHKSQLSQIISERDSEKANLELIKLQVEKFKFEPESKQDIKSKELEIAEIKMDRINNKLKLKKQVFANELKIQNIRIEQIKKSIVEAKKALTKLDLGSPYEGILQLERNSRTRKTVEIGDEVHQGQQIASIPDMSKIKVLSSINETDISKVKIGQDVIVHLDAYPEFEFHGKIQYLGKFSHKKDNNNPIKVFDTEIVIDETNEALKPGMTVNCEIVVEDLKNMLFIENECVMREGNNYFVVDQARGGKTKIPVEVVASNNLFTAIKGDIMKGQKLMTRNEYQLLAN